MPTRRDTSPWIAGPSRPRWNAEGRFHPEMQTLPMQSFIDLSDGQNGLAVLNNCFTEYQAIDGGETTLAITLFRAVRNIICTEFRSAGVFPDQDGGQLQQTLEYQFALVPHEGDWREAGLPRQAQTFNAPPTTVQTTAHRLGRLPTRGSLYALESESLVVSAMKKAEDRETYIVRVYNPTGAAANGTLRLASKIRAAWRVSLNEDRREPLPIGVDNSLSIAAGPSKIVTLEIDVE